MLCPCVKIFESVNTTLNTNKINYKYKVKKIKKNKNKSKTKSFGFVMDKGFSGWEWTDYSHGNGQNTLVPMQEKVNDRTTHAGYDKEQKTLQNMFLNVLILPDDIGHHNNSSENHSDILNVNFSSFNHSRPHWSNNTSDHETKSVTSVKTRPSKVSRTKKKSKGQKVKSKTGKLGNHDGGSLSAVGAATKKRVSKTQKHRKVSKAVVHPSTKHNAKSKEAPEAINSRQQGRALKVHTQSMLSVGPKTREEQVRQRMMEQMLFEKKTNKIKPIINLLTGKKGANTSKLIDIKERINRIKSYYGVKDPNNALEKEKYVSPEKQTTTLDTSPSVLPLVTTSFPLKKHELNATEMIPHPNNTYHKKNIQRKIYHSFDKNNFCKQSLSSSFALS
ncbi:hypothetical protein RFI_23274 [Reticulomyxa filosa]|uniref:Uncharacterized protein n=1 Tax=Reticulomyxa filosa TaxID=46433 RepID=X6MLY2_RETFI|nr:hypothetical protein RFI_23274 [Reticulomyxa filosa]|eukprot:ETO14095.1 hypothetical protein RFI_23274 [Reticulomyxa filosa]